MRASDHADPRDRYVHHVPGRLRVRISLVRQNPKPGAEAVQLLLGQPGVESAAANDLTGSLTVRYDATYTTGRTILAALRETGWIGLEVVIPPSQIAMHPAWLNSEVGYQLARQVALYALEKVAEHSVAALIAAVL